MKIIPVCLVDWCRFDNSNPFRMYVRLRTNDNPPSFDGLRSKSQ